MADTVPESVSSLFTADRFERSRSWPLISHVVPNNPIPEAERAEANATIESCMAVVRELIGDVDPKCIRFCGDGRDHYVSEECHSYNFLMRVLLSGARTVEQVRDIVAGYVIYCMNKGIAYWREEGRAFRDSLIAKLPEEVRGGFRSLPAFEESRAEAHEWWQMHYHHVHVSASTGHFECMPDADVFLHFEQPLNLRQRRRYNYEPNHDCLQTMLSDTGRVFCKHTGVSEEGLVERKIPEHKRMTPEKVSRFISLPCLFKYINVDAEMGDEAIASNLTLIAEYFCENDDVLCKNDVEKEDIDRWMREKFDRHNPSLHVATYIWARFLGTEFEETALWIEQYILDLLEKDSPWIFELAGREREQCRVAGDLFDVYEKAMISAEEGGDSKAADLLWIIPAKELLEASMAGKNYKGNAAIKGLHGRVSDLYVYLPDKYSMERYESDFYGFCVDLFQEKIKPLTEWRAIEGFELLDPMAIDGYSKTRGWTYLGDLLKGVAQRMKEMKPSDLLKFKEAVVDVLPAPFKQKALRIVTDIAEKWAVSVSFEGCETGTLADMAMGAKGLARPALVLPGGLTLDAFCGEGFAAKRADALAERAVLERHLNGVRGGGEIVKYLLAHRGSMVPVDLVTPRPDAPNLDIIKEFGDSSDLLSLLAVATLLVYLGYDYDQVMAEVRQQAEISESAHHPDLTSIGVEYEQLGATPEGRIISETRYSWLFNVLAAGGDYGSNELTTPPTLSAVMQRYIFALITDPRFQFINMRMLWDISAREDRCPSGLHVNTAVPKDLPFSGELVMKYMAPLQEMQWLANGGKVGQQHVSRGVVRGWKSCALLDVLDDKNRDHKVEFKNLWLDEGGDYARQIEMLQLLSSAGIQFMREKAGLKLSSSGRVMAQIYERFRVESQIILQAPGDVNVMVAARALMEKFADAARAELNCPNAVKREGIVVYK